MINIAANIEIILHWLCSAASILTLMVAIYNVLSAQARPAGQQTKAAARVLRSPYLIAASFLFFSLGYMLWKPVPLQLAWQVQFLCSLSGAVVLLCSLAVYWWGMRTLGKNYNASSGFGVRLQQEHQLVKTGPYAYLRHPMYLAVILAFWGGLLLYRTWTMVGYSLLMFGLFYRAAVEEQALAVAFGKEWEIYRQSVPAWIPCVIRRVKKDRS